MKTDPYVRFKTEELILRDYLATDRTVLANERTLLSYVRTSLAFAAAGAALIHFFDSVVTEVVGWILMPLAMGILVVGLQRYLQVRRRLSKIIEKSKSTTE